MGDTVKGTLRICREIYRKSYTLKNGTFFHGNHFFEALDDQIVKKMGTQLHMDII